jgi:dihydrofolate reductase
MRTLALVEFVSLDGVMQGLAGPDGDFPYPGWGRDYPVAPPEGGGPGATSAYLFGRRTFTEMAAFWPTQPDDNPMAAGLNHTPKYVVSRTLATPSWQPTTVLSGDVGTAVSRLKAEGEGTIVVLGSGQLARFLLGAGLVDALTLFVHPVLLGTGVRLFGELPQRQRLRLTSSTASGVGSLVLTYELTER